LEKKYTNYLKTMLAPTAQLVTELNERRQTTFTLADVRAITGLRPASARSLLSKAQARGLVTRLKPGLFNLVPFELGRATEHVANPYLVGRDLVAGAPYFISHGSAFELHRMVTQPQLTITVSSARRILPRVVRGYSFRFILVPPERFFGVTQIWITKEQSVSVSDPERSIIDGLRHPRHVGGVTEVAKALWMCREKIDTTRLVDYALRFDVGAVMRRLGFLLDFYRLADDETLAPLLVRISTEYQLLEPLLPATGPMQRRWRLRLNIEPEELDLVRHG